MLPMTVYSLTGRARSLTTLTAENAFNTDSIFKKKKRLCCNCLLRLVLCPYTPTPSGLLKLGLKWKKWLATPLTPLTYAIQPIFMLFSTAFDGNLSNVLYL